MTFATKPELARKVAGRALSAGVPFSSFTADEAYSQNSRLRDWLEEQQISYVMAVPVSEPGATSAGKIRADALSPPRSRPAAARSCRVATGRKPAAL